MAELTAKQQARLATLPEPGSVEDRLDGIIRCCEVCEDDDAEMMASSALSAVAELARLLKEMHCDG